MDGLALRGARYGGGTVLVLQRYSWFNMVLLFSSASVRALAVHARLRTPRLHQLLCSASRLEGRPLNSTQLAPPPASQLSQPSESHRKDKPGIVSSVGKKQ